MTREEAIKTLKDRIEQYTGGVPPGEREILLEAFAALRENPCDNCVGPGLAIAHGYKDMRTKKPEVEG